MLTIFEMDFIVGQGFSRTRGIELQGIGLISTPERSLGTTNSTHFTGTIRAPDPPFRVRHVVHASENDLKQVIGILSLRLLHGKFQPIWCWLVTRIDIVFFSSASLNSFFTLNPLTYWSGTWGRRCSRRRGRGAGGLWCGWYRGC